LLNDGVNPRDYEWAIVDALQSSVDADKVTFIHDNRQIEGKLRNNGKLAECQKYCQKNGKIGFTVQKRSGRPSEKSIFHEKLNFKANVDKVVLYMLLKLNK
jgi:hypothetical protein